jgi:SAM-dependent methyltransferase
LSERYDAIGRTYTATRREDPRLAAAIRSALGDVASVLDVGGGAGAYEPAGLDAVAVEPSAVMLAQRPEGAAPAVQGVAEELPFGDDSFDAAMAVLSDHHWRDRDRGLREMRRVARERVVLFNADPAAADRFWLTCEYLPGFLELIPEPYRESGYWADELERLLGPLEITPFPLPWDCSDGFYGAFWRRPEAYLDPAVREGISVFAALDPAEVEAGLARLASDLESGRWREAHADLLEADVLDLGYRIVTARAG